MKEISEGYLSANVFPCLITVEIGDGDDLNKDEMNIDEIEILLLRFVRKILLIRLTWGYLYAVIIFLDDLV